MKRHGYWSGLFSAALGRSHGAVSSPPSWNTRAIIARYDAAQTTTDNAAHWSMATNMSADNENSPGVRRTLRNRCRYEAANNPWLRGLLETLADDVIGTGPRLQIHDDRFRWAAEAEESFARWSAEVKLGSLLRTARIARGESGEAVFIITNNPASLHPVKLDIMLLECDRLASPLAMLNDPKNIDGVLLDDRGRPAEYQILQEHPGDVFTGGIGQAVTIPARYVVHWFSRTRPEQHRGIPELTPALPLIALHRRYMLAMVQKMETSANVFGTMETGNLPPETEWQEGKPFEFVDLPRNGMMTLPANYKFSQASLGTPSDSQNAFSIQVKIDTARALNMPRSAALGDSSGYNYASGRLDWQSYSRRISVERSELKTDMLSRVLRFFLMEYRPGWRFEDELPLHTWYWDGREHVDPNKEATAAINLVSEGLETREHYYGKQGRDWEVELRQSLKEEQREMELRRELGLPPRESKPPAIDPDDKEDEEKNSSENPKGK